MAKNDDLDYVVKMNKALAAWCDCDKDNRGFFLVAYDKKSGNGNSYAGMMGSGEGIVNSLIGAYETSEDFKGIFESLCIHVAYKKAKSMMG